MEDTESIEQKFNWIELVDSIKWPIAIIIIIILFLKPIKNLINRITKVGFGNKTLEASQQSVTKKIEDQEISAIDRAINLFRTETIEMFEDAVERETDINKLKSDSERIERLKNYSTIIYIKRHFDTIYTSIFGSQIRILQRLNTLNPENKDSIEVYYENAKRSNPNFYENYSYNDYLHFLINFNLIIVEKDETIQITILGADFLKYLIESNKDLDKLF